MALADAVDREARFEAGREMIGSARIFALAVSVRACFVVLALLADYVAPDYDNSMLAEHKRRDSNCTQSIINSGLHSTRYAINCC